jgi:hypothetical protein
LRIVEFGFAAIPQFASLDPRKGSTPMHDTIRYLGSTIELLVQQVGDAWVWSFQTDGGVRQQSDGQNSSALSFPSRELARESGLVFAKSQVCKLRSKRPRPRRGLPIDGMLR